MLSALWHQRSGDPGRGPTLTSRFDKKQFYGAILIWHTKHEAVSAEGQNLTAESWYLIAGEGSEVFA